jgi:hypothetical protein
MKYFYFKTRHEMLLSPRYTALSPAARGVLGDLRALASLARNESEPVVDGATGYTFGALVRWYGQGPATVRTALRVLVDAGWIEVQSDTGFVRVMGWLESQEAESAERVRRHRERRGDRYRNVALERTEHSGEEKSTGQDTTPPVSPKGGSAPPVSLSGDLEKVLAQVPTPVMSANEQTAHRLANIYHIHTAKKGLHGRAQQCFREALAAGMSPETLEGGIMSASKLAPPWEIVQACRTDIPGRDGKERKSFREKEEEAEMAQMKQAIAAGVARAKARGAKEA